ncbi:hypothetical protein ACJJTC_012446 [Scirpophaga incertulas]
MYLFKCITCYTDDLILARRKAKEAEFTNDLTDGEVRQKRKIRNPVSSTDEEDDPFHDHKSVQKSNKREIFENPGEVRRSCRVSSGRGEKRLRWENVAWRIAPQYELQILSKVGYEFVKMEHLVMAPVLKLDGRNWNVWKF